MTRLFSRKAGVGSSGRSEIDRAKRHRFHRVASALAMVSTALLSAQVLAMGSHPPINLLAYAKPADNTPPLNGGNSPATGQKPVVAPAPKPTPAPAPAPSPAPAPAPAPTPPQPEGLKGIPVPLPSNLNDFISDKAAAIRLGKALFWDTQVGTDGQTACATCHFNAGADSRTKNQVAPTLNRMSDPKTPQPSSTFQPGGPNYTLKAQDFPFHQFADPANQDSAVVRSTDGIAGSQGVFNRRFLSAMPGASADVTNLAGDNLFHVGGVQTRRVTPRNAPTVINAIFNARLFWDGRASFLFNGVNPFGGTDPNARVYQASGNQVTPVAVRINNAALASLATGPALSDVEMSSVGRTWPEIGRRLLPARPLAQQRVSGTDSVLGYLAASETGLKVKSYEDMVKAAFKPQWWNGQKGVQIDATGKGTVITLPPYPGSGQYTQAQANFSLLFGLAIQMYGSTLVSDDTPFDQYMAGNRSALNASQLSGMAVFFGKGNCSKCHSGAEFSTASVRNVTGQALDRMAMADGTVAVYDTGFNNTSVTRTLDDLGVGATNGVGKPMSSSTLATQMTAAEFERVLGYPPGKDFPVKPDRVSANGSFKVPTLRNIELTAPYFHNGGAATLEQVVEFYNRGGNFRRNNLRDHDNDVTPLGLTAQERADLVSFMKALTDSRVRYAKAPFDRPQIKVPFGHEGDTRSVAVKDQVAKDVWVTIPEVGAAGGAPLPRFLEGQTPTAPPPVSYTGW